MADTWALLGFYSAVPPGDAYPRAKQAARQALDIDPALAEAYPAFAYSAMYYDWDWVEAEQAFRRAIELHPGYANAHQWYGNFLSVMGRAEEAIATFERALALDPLSALKYAALGWGCYFARRYQRGEEECRRGVELEPTSVVAHGWMMLNLLSLGRDADAVAAAEETARLSGYGVSSLGLLGYAYGAAGRRADARSVLERLTTISATRYISQYDVALIHLALGHGTPLWNGSNEATPSGTTRWCSSKWTPDSMPSGSGRISAGCSSGCDSDRRYAGRAASISDIVLKRSARALASARPMASSTGAGDLGPQSADGGNGPAQDPARHVGEGATRIRRLARQHLVQHASQAVDVRPLVEVGLFPQLLRAHVVERPHDHAGLGELGVVRRADGTGEAEIRDQGAPAGEEDVLGLHVAVQHPAARGRTRGPSPRRG